MSEEYNFSELRNYLAAQIDLGDADLLLDEPWTPVKKAAAVPPRPVSRNLPPSFPTAKPAAQEVRAESSEGLTVPKAPIPDNTGFTGSFFGDIPKAPLQNESAVPAPRTFKKTANAYESVQSLDEFYETIRQETLYAKEPQVLRYAGPEKPRLLFLLQAAKTGETAEDFLSTPVGEMLVRLFANLGYSGADIGITYFFKSTERPLAPLLDVALRKMLAKEVSFINPEIMVTFGQPLFYKVMGKNKNFDELAGSALDFEGQKTVCLVDPYAMVNDKQMKWLTWKIHIPRSGLFTVKA